MKLFYINGIICMSFREVVRAGAIVKGKAGDSSMGNVELLVKLEELKELRAQLEVLEEQKAALEDEVKAEMLSRGVDKLSIGTHRVQWTKYKMSRFDSRAFRKEHEEMYQQYHKETEASRFLLS